MYNAILKNTYLVYTIIAKIISPYVYCHKFPVVFKIHLLHSMCTEHEHERGRHYLSHLINDFLSFEVMGKSHLIFCHCLDESLDLYWDLSVMEQIQAIVVEMTLVRLEVLLRWRN